MWVSMADKKRKYDDNVPGRFYVDKECINCDACSLAAPDNFSMDPDSGHAFVSKQPSSPDEEAQCKEAMEGCPVEAIGNDGES
jgi:ferredoxin